MQTIRGDPQALKQQTPPKTKGIKIYLTLSVSKRSIGKGKRTFPSSPVPLEGHRMTVHTPHYAHVSIHQYGFMDALCLTLSKALQEAVKIVFSEDG